MLDFETGRIVEVAPNLDDSPLKWIVIRGLDASPCPSLTAWGSDCRSRHRILLRLVATHPFLVMLGLIRTKGAESKICRIDV